MKVIFPDTAKLIFPIQAILSSPEKRLTLSQVYDWMVQNIPYFKDKGDSNSSAGWKVSPINIFSPKIVVWQSLCGGGAY